jgi:putative transposase
MELVLWEKYRARIQAKASIIDYIEMPYNSNRHHSYLGYITPMEFEGKWLLLKVA